LLAVSGTAFGAATGNMPADSYQHFDPNGKLPSEFTVKLREIEKANLPFADKRDFEEAKRGLIAAPPYKQILAEAGNVAWDLGSYQWLLDGKDFTSIHPSLQRQAILNMAYGLYEVLPGKIYQMRGYDLANISFIKSDTGWIVFDPLTCKETAAPRSRSSTKSSVPDQSSRWFIPTPIGTISGRARSR
jgi:alkyl sulfatase BDS1-like metallo-beta-lactamase superfamily hydrolase